MPEEEIKVQFEQIIKTQKSFDPFALSDKLKDESKARDLKFNPNFFDDSEPGD